MKPMEPRQAVEIVGTTSDATTYMGGVEYTRQLQTRKAHTSKHTSRM